MDRPLNGAEQLTIAELWRAGIALLREAGALVGDTQPAAVVAAVRAYIDAMRKGDAPRLSKAAREQISYCIGTVWGEAFRGSLGWRWSHLSYGGGAKELYAVVSRDRSRVLHPHLYIYDLLRDPHRANHSGLLFFKCGHGHLHQAKPASYTLVA